MATDIQIYGADWCGLTRAIREYLTRNRIDYSYFDIEHDADAQAFVTAMGDGRRFPLVVIEQKVLIVPRTLDLQRVLDEYRIGPARQ